MLATGSNAPNIPMFGPPPPTTLKKRQHQNSSWDIAEPFQLTIHAIEKLNCSQSVEIAIQGKFVLLFQRKMGH